MTQMIHGWEAGVQLPLNRDAYAHHLQLFKALRQQAPGWEHHEDGLRRVQFHALPGPGGQAIYAIVRFTGGECPPGLPMREVRQAIEAGQTLTIGLRLSATQKTTGTDKHEPIPEDKLAGYVERKLEQAGLALTEDASFFADEDIFVGKRGGFATPTVRVKGPVVVRDPEAVVHAWSHGVGRLRTFGLGMLRLEAP